METSIPFDPGKAWLQMGAEISRLLLLHIVTIFYIYHDIRRRENTGLNYYIIMRKNASYGQTYYQISPLYFHLKYQFISVVFKFGSTFYLSVELLKILKLRLHSTLTPSKFLKVEASKEIVVYVIADNRKQIQGSLKQS